MRVCKTTRKTLQQQTSTHNIYSRLTKNSHDIQQTRLLNGYNKVRVTGTCYADYSVLWKWYST